MNTKKAIRLINQLTVREIDTAMVNDHPFISIAGTGFDAEVACLFSKHPKRGFLSYVKIAFKAYFNYKEKEYSIKSGDGLTENIHALMICFANSNQFGNDFVIAPRARLNDGLIDVCIVKKIPFLFLPFTIIMVWLRLIMQSPYYKHFQAKTLTIHLNEKQMLNIDGEAVLEGQELELSVNPSSINIICPNPY